MYPDEAQLLDRIKRGDQTAFGFLFKTYAPRLRQYARRFTLSFDAADDIVQECFIRFWERRAELRSLSLRSLLFAMVRNACLNYLEHEGLIEMQNLDDFVRTDGEERLYNLDFRHNPEQSLLYTELRQRLHAALDELSPRCRQVFTLSRFQGLKNREIATRLGISTTAVEKHISKALHHLALRLGKNGLTLALLFYPTDLLQQLGIESSMLLSLFFQTS